MNRLHSSVALLSIVASAVPAAAQDSKLHRFTPSSPWAMEYADSSCKLIRSFSDGKEEITLALERTEPGYIVAMGLTGSPLKSFRSAKQATVAFPPAGGEKEIPLATRQLADGRPFYLLNPVSFVPVPDFTKMKPEEAMKAMGTPPTVERELAAAANVNAIALTKGFTDEVELEVGPMAAPMKAMQSCMDDLVTQWGLDAAAHHKLTRVAFPLNMDKLSKPFQFPMRQWREGREGLVRYRLKVDTEGKPTDCAVTGSSGSASVDTAACAAMMKEWHFMPALDAAGKPIPSFYSSQTFFSTVAG